MQPWGWERRQSEEECVLYLWWKGDISAVQFLWTTGRLHLCSASREIWPLAGQWPEEKERLHTCCLHHNLPWQKPACNVLYHYVMVLYTQATYERTYIPAVHTKHYFEIWYSMYMYFFFKCSESRKKNGNCWELQRAWDMTHKDDSDSNCCVWKLISWEAKQRLQDNLVKLISTLSLSASLIHAKSGHDCVGYPSFDILQQVITFVCLTVNKCLKRTEKSLLQMWTETQVSM